MYRTLIIYLLRQTWSDSKRNSIDIENVRWQCDGSEGSTVHFVGGSFGIGCSFGDEEIEKVGRIEHILFYLSRCLSVCMVLEYGNAIAAGLPASYGRLCSKSDEGRREG